METDILEHPVRLLNSVLLLFCFLSSCEVAKSSPSLIASADTLKLVNKNGVKHFNGVPFSGKLFKQEVKTGDTLFIENYFKGLKHGIFKRFYPNNILYEKRYYNMGEKEGVHLGYWKNGQLAFQYHLEDNVYHGSLKSWNKQGQIIKFLNYFRGQPLGQQQLWEDNGTVRTNYVIKNNRRYGLLGTKNCVNVSDSLQ